MASRIGVGGRPPKPTEQKRRTGNPGKRPLPAKSETVTLVPFEGIPPVPITLGEPGRALWRTLLGGPSKAWLGSTDLLKLETLCHLQDDCQNFRRIIAEDGITLTEPIVTPAGHVIGERIVPHPLFKELRSAEKLLSDFASSLGLDPTARSRLGIAEVKRQSAIEEFRERQAARRSGVATPLADGKGRR